MKFIEVTNEDGKRYLVNMDKIEVVQEKTANWKGSLQTVCELWLRTGTISTRESYAIIMDLIKRATGDSV